MISRIIKLGQIGALLGLLGACASITNLTGAKTLKEGKFEAYAGVDYSNLLRKVDGTSTDSKTFGIDAAGRYGFTDNDEVGLKLANTFAYIGGDYKRALIKGGPFFLSTGAGLGYLNYKVSVGNTDSSLTQIDMYVPVYADYYVSEGFGLLASPKIMYSIVSGDASTSYATFVISGGVRLGAEKGLHLEAGYGIPFKNTIAKMWQLNAGFFF